MKLPIANEAEVPYKLNLFRMWFGQIGTTEVYVWADSFEDAFEEAVEWADDQGLAGYFEDVSVEDLKEAAEDLGIAWKEDWPQVGVIDDDDFMKVLSQAEADLTIIGHTQLKSGNYIRSDEWGGDGVDLGSEEYQEVLTRSARAEYTFSRKLHRVVKRQTPPGYRRGWVAP